ncbi:GAF and ANTAR domain-containing protein [Nitrospiraceae bacterium HYJII51-Mn-bac16s-1-B09]|uniref:GAF and ANTAR domain-containing protein n=2 Tax=Candidatus Manganitrophus noduliformans TaxID=2606439 RepID=A0A7X6IC67_9BACT|nr:GAF and ANTAR domain-containing protein [Candidatus Manganitrophus noduliformans]
MFAMPTRAQKTVSTKKGSAKGALEQKTRELGVLHRITEQISSNLELEVVLKEIVEMVVEITQADACLLYLLDETQKELTLRASKNPHPKLIGRIRLELGEGITGWVAKEKKMVAIAKDASEDPRFALFHNLPEDRYHAFLSVPVISKGEIIGVINIQHKKPHYHSDGEIALLTTIGHQVGSAIENARLYEEMKRKAMQIDTLSRMSTMIASNRYLEEILNLIVTMTAGMMNSKICSIMLLDEPKGELKIVATQSLSEEYRQKANVKIGESVSGRVVKERRPITVLDVTGDPHFRFPELAKKEGLFSLLSVPMMIKDRVIGVINSYTSKEHHFTPEEINILQTVANQAAVAIENTTLVQQSSAMQEALETRKAVERAKGILMKQGKISEEESFRLIQRQSMNTRKTMREIAEAIILASEIKKG